MVSHYVGGKKANIPNRMFIAFDLVGNHCITWWRDWRSGEAKGNHTEGDISMDQRLGIGLGRKRHTESKRGAREEVTQLQCKQCKII